jgi:phage terminase small subunit
MSAYAKLRRKRQLFVDAYVECGVGTVAAIKAGYTGKNANVAAAKILTNPEVKAAVLERQEQAIAKAGVRHVRVLEEAAKVAFASLAQARGADGKVRPFKDLPPELLEGAQSIEFNPDGSVKNIRLAKLDGLRLLSQYLKLLTEVHEHSGKDGGPIETHELTDLEKARRIAHLLAQGLRASRPATVLSDPVDPEDASPDPDSESDRVV